MGMASALYQPPLKLEGIHPRFRLPFEFNQVPIRAQPFSDQAGVEDSQVSPQVGPRLPLVLVRPEESGQGITAVRPAADSQKDEQRQGFTALEINWYSIQFDPWWAK